MDRFTRNYSAGLGIIALALIGIWLHSTWQLRVSEINAVLQSDPLVAK